MSGGPNVPNQPAQGQNAQQQGNQAQNNPVPQNPAPQWGARPQARRGVGPQPLAGRQAALQPGVGAPPVQNPANNPAPVLPQNPQPLNAPVNNPGLAVPQQLPPLPQPGVGAPPVQNPANNPAPVLQNPQPVNAPVNNPGLVVPQQLPPLPQPGVGAPPVQNPANNPAPVLQNPQPVNAPVNNPGLVVPQQLPPLPQPGVGAPPVQNPANNPAPVLQNPQPVNAPVNNPGLVVPQQLPPQPLVPQPPDMTGYTSKGVAEVDQVKLKVRRWSVSTLTALGLNPRSSQDRVLASTVATAARIDESSCQPNVGLHCSATLKQTFTQVQLAQDPAFSGLVGALETFENSGRWGNGQKKARGTNEVAPLRQAAAVYEQSLQNVANPDPTKRAALDEVKRVTRAFELRDQVTSYGQPPWDTNTAKQASKAKVELDILSMPAGSRVAQPPPGGVGGVNTKVWIKRTGGTGQEQGSYICKPAAASTVDGIPDGGEAAREALVQRAGRMLSQKLGVDLNIPETHSIALDNSFLPPNLQNPNGASTACSIQELRPNQGPATGKSKQELSRVPKGQVHGLIALDICTLNLDRHDGNLLMDANGEIVPIDHGASLPEPVLNKRKRGLARVRDAMPSPHNAMLKFPQAHEPMSDDMRSKLKNMKVGAIKAQLAAERNDIAQEMGQANNQLAGQATLSDAALDTSERAMKFMKLAAQDYKVLSPAAVQLALGKNATILLDPDVKDKQFALVAERALGEAVKNQAVIKQACLMNPVEHQAMKDMLAQGGWDFPMQTAPGASVLCDPALALKLALGGTAVPKPLPPFDANAPKTAPPVPGKGAPTPTDQQAMETVYPRLKQQSAVANYQIDMAEEWAAFKELRKIIAELPEELAEILTFKVVSSDSKLQFPTMMLRAIHQMRQIKVNFATAERQNGGALPAIQNQLLNLKVTAAQQIIALMRGPLNRQFTQSLLQAQPNGLDAVTGVSDNAFERVRANFRLEVDGLQNGNAITAAQASTMQDGIDAGSLVAVDQLLNAVPGHNRPNSV